MRGYFLAALLASKYRRTVSACSWALLKRGNFGGGFLRSFMIPAVRMNRSKKMKIIRRMKRTISVLRFIRSVNQATSSRFKDMVDDYE